MAMLLRRRRVPQLFRRYLHSYEDKIHKLAEQRGLTVSELRAKIQQEQKKEERENYTPPTISEPARKDSSPVKPLSSLLNLTRIFATPHTADQVSALWTVYHESRSNGTGRGYLCASIPLGIYTQMAVRATKYPMFVLPLKRTNETPDGEAAHEFYLLQWALHESPPTPSATEDNLFFAPPSSEKPPTAPNPPTSHQYKSRTTYATPYLVLTNYTDLAQSHGIVLLRGEPHSTRGTLLPQQDALRLTKSMQNFYLDASPEREKLLRAFHETPAEFEWKELLKHAI
ncbi:ATP11 protein-domain-containing protein [Mycena amicta]|nr:ATP11 protein-domain-containing protein [Mycena amicta]